MNSSDLQHDRLALIQQGRESVALMGILTPYIDDHVNKLVHRMAAAYRSGTADFPLLLGIAAQVSGLMDLLSTLDSRARQGDVAAMKELGDGTR